MTVDASQVKAARPKGRLITDLKAIPLKDTVVTVKCDGEFQVIDYENGQATMFNQWGRTRTDLPCLTEFREKLQQQEAIKSIRLLAECYAVDGEKMLRLPDLLSILKSANCKQPLRLAVFDFDRLNGRTVNETYKWKLGELANWLGIVTPESKAYVVPHIFPRTPQDIEAFWNEYVVKKGYEGLFTRSNSDFLKVKPRLEADAAIIGINKDHESFNQQQARSLKLALRDEHGGYVILGDVGSGITHELGKKLWALTQLKVSEDQKVLWLKPHAIATIVFEALYEKEQARLIFENGELYDTGLKVPFVSMRHPRLERFRPDKKPTWEDIPISQVINGEV